MTDFKVFTPEGMEPYQNAIEQMENCLRHPNAVAGALMADHHLGYAMPIGGVVRYEDAVSPTGVGFDIACGNMAVATDISLIDLAGEEAVGSADVLDSAIRPIMSEIRKKIDFGVGGSRSRSAGWVDAALFEEGVWSEIDRQFGAGLKDKARAQLGTVGSGNHYVDLLVDRRGLIWVANHFGSRGLGHTIASGFFAAAEGLKFTERVKEGDDPVVLDTKSELGTFYIAAMQLAGDYAYAGREFVINQVLDILGDPGVTRIVHNHHNYAWFEDGDWVVRKGATPLTRGPAFIGGSMGDISVIVRGREVEEFQGYDMRGSGAIADIGALGSAPHGAGRVMSRTAAAGKMRKFWSCSNRDCDYTVKASPGTSNLPEGCPQCQGRKFKKLRMRDPETASIDWTAARASLTARGVTVLGAGADESPGVYKPLSDVLAAHSNIEILEVLEPIGVVMAGADIYDPYKD